MPERWCRALVVLAGLAGLALGAGPVVGWSPQREEVVARAKPAVVLVEVTRTTGGGGHGSGFIYESSGYILTNHHVVEGASDVRVTLSDGRAFPARVVDFKRVEDADMSLVVDAAVLKIDASGLPTLPLQSTRPVREGQEILVLGFPGGLATDRMSVTRGIVSAARDGWIETDAVIVPGNSGGPILDTSGRVIGVATFITGYARRFGGAMWIENAAALAARALDPAGERSRVINVPGLEYFMPRDPTSRRYSDLHQKTFRVTASDDTQTNDVTEEVESAGDYNGARLYDMRSLYRWPESRSNYLADSSGLYDLSSRVDSTWVRTATAPVMVAPLPLAKGRSWDFQETWRRDSRTDLAQAIGAPPRPMSMSVDGRVRIDSVSDTVMVPAGAYRNCVSITVDLRLTTNQGDREQRITTTWYAAGVGKVKTVGQGAGTGRRVTSELVSVRWAR